MTLTIPLLGQPLNDEQSAFIEIFARSCRRSIIEMTCNAQSGHPGGSLSSIDYLALLYAFLIGRTGEKTVVSNGHISPAVYSVLGEMGFIDKEAAVRGFRKIGEIYEGHVTRHVRGVWYGTGPLGIGVSVASGMALAEKLKASGERVYGVIGDGEAQEGQVYEMMNFAHRYALDNFILFMDYNKVQLTDSLEAILPLNFRAIFEAAGWEVIEVDAHDVRALWNALSTAHTVQGRPILLLGNSIMGHGVEFMAKEGRAHKATWHGNAPKPEDTTAALDSTELSLSSEDTARIAAFLLLIQAHPPVPVFTPPLTPMPDVKTGEPIVYEAGTVMDCRTAYGKALLNLATLNSNVLALTADLRASVMTKFVAEAFPERHIDVGIAEQHMVSCSGGLSLSGFIPFCSTFGAFLSSRAKDQARVNDINQTNVKMVATHCGLSVGEDGPTHQSIDDMGSFLGLFHTQVIEPADANQCDRIIRYAASHYGNFYVRMGRHKFEVLTKEDGTPFYDAAYRYDYGRCDVIRPGTDLTIAASGAMVRQALTARTLLEGKVSVEVVAVSSIKKFDDTLMSSIRKTRRVITLEDHNTLSGLGGQLARALQMAKIEVAGFAMMGVKEYQLSGTWDQLYASAGLSPESIAQTCISVYN